MGLEPLSLGDCRRSRLYVLGRRSRRNRCRGRFPVGFRVVLSRGSTNYGRSPFVLSPLGEGVTFLVSPAGRGAKLDHEAIPVTGSVSPVAVVRNMRQSHRLEQPV